MPEETVMETTETIREPRRLVRPRDGRWLGGVAAGLGEYFDLSPAIYRIAFVALALAGGTGILLYVAAWLVIPDEVEEDSVAARMLKEHAERPSRAVGLALLAFVAIFALSYARFWPGPGAFWLALALAAAALVWWEVSPQGAARAAGGGEAGAAAAARRRSLLPGALGAVLLLAGLLALLDATGVWNVDWRIALAALVLLTGGLVVAGAAIGLRVGAVATLGLLLLCALALAVAIRVPVFAGWGDRVAHPASAATVADRYRFGVGHYTVDLGDVTLPAGETSVRATLGIGDLRVVVPREATVRVDARASVGQLSLFGRVDSGTSVHEVFTDAGSSPLRVLVLDARVGIGQVEVVRG
jgi:phage shock protein PspC (stress-responsive transcriptional regulator)